MEKIYKKVVMVGMTGIIFLTGCGNGMENNTNTDTKVMEEMPFDLEEIEKSGQTIDVSYSWGIENYDKSEKVISYSGRELKIDFRFKNMGSDFRAGIMIFIDGVAQQYSIEQGGLADYIVPFDVSEDEEKELSIYMIPKLAQNVKEHTIYFASIYNPEYHASEDAEGYGLYHEISQQAAWKLKCDGKIKEIEVANTAEFYKLTKEEKDYYVVKNRDGTVSNGLQTLRWKFLQNENEIVGGKVNVNENLELQLFGGMVDKYRVSVFIDNKPVPLFAGCLYEDIEIKDGKKTIVSLDFANEIQEIKDYSSMYFVLCPISASGYDEDFMLEKTDSLILKR